MKQTLKKLFLLIINFFAFSFLISAAPVDSIEEYTLENGMKVFLLEDNSDALVHIEYTCKAGFSSQTQNSCGFFKLYTRLIEQNAPISFTEAQCNSDSSRYSINATPQQTDSTLETLAQLFFAPAFTDETISTELEKLKKEVSANANELSTYLNAAIDSRVFSDAPWKNDSGIYPPIFKKTTNKNARNIIQDISTRWYIPQNSAIFIYGNINPEKLHITLKQTFGRFYSNYQTPIEKPLIPVNKQRKYVFHHPELSPELTQIVIQYTMMNIEECDLLSAVLNNDVSTFKQKLLNIPELNIPGAEYIDVSSAHKRNNSRLIIQALMQPPENKSTSITSEEQTQIFINQVQEIYSSINPMEVEFAKKQLNINLNSIKSTPGYFMTQLASYWAMDPYIQNNEYNYNENAPLADMMINQFDKADKISLEELSLKLKSENPFIFTIINSKDYKKNQKAYKTARFEEINENNSSWYVQSMYNELKEQFNTPEYSGYYTKKATNDNLYFQRNINQINRLTLKNGINVILKKNQNSTDIAMLISIKGGKLNSPDDNGFEEIMINLLGGMIEKEIAKKQYDNIIAGYPQLSTQTDISTSSILITFEKEDQYEVCKAVSNAIVYGEIAPAAADKAVSSKQYRKLLENGSATNQLYSAGIKALYGKTDFPKIFDSEKDVLENTDYSSILIAYPAFLDAGRYSIIITGNFDDEIQKHLENTMGILSNNQQKLNIPENIPEVTKSKNLSVKIRHTFLTDIPAEKAGPQPAVLIPTTEFLDPVIYITKSPAPNSKSSALYNAILNYFGVELQAAINGSSKLKDAKVTIELPVSRLNFGTVIIQNVSHTKEADSIYKTVLQNISRKLNDPYTSKATVQEIQNFWVLAQLQESASNSGTARLIHKGFELMPDHAVPEYYLTEYSYIMDSTIQDYIDILELFPAKANLKIYSTESKD